MRTPITYYGGKQQLAPLILGLIPQHEVYNEPFFGGGAIFFAKRPAKREFINDISAAMVNFYRVLKSDFEALKGLIDETLHSEGTFKEAKELYLNGCEDSVRWAWAVFVCSHQSMYSILDGSWRVSTVTNSAKEWQTCKRWFSDVYAKRLEATSIFCRDAVSQIKAVDDGVAFHYCDPPYFNSDCGCYEGYTEEDFRRLLSALEGIKGKFLLSSYPSDVLTEFVERNGWRSMSVSMSKSAGSKAGSQKVEVLTYNYDAERDRQRCLF